MMTVLLTVLKGGQDSTIIDAETHWIECPGLTEENCEKSLCHFQKVVNGPSCFMRQDSFGFLVQNVDEEGDKSLSIRLINITQDTPYGKSMKNVIFKLTYVTENILRFQFKDADKDRYEVPVQTEFPLLKKPPTVNIAKLSYEIEYTNESQVFNFAVKRKDDGEILWDTSIGGLLLSDQYLQISSYLPSRNVYGLGEHVHDSLKHDLDFTSWPMFAADRPPEVKSDFRNLYGVHPFYTCLERSGKSHGVFFLNSNAMEASFMPSPAVTFRTIGGILDFFIFVGDSPEHVTQLYTSLVGRPMMPPYWSLGFQLSRYGHENLSSVQKVIARTMRASIPLAVQHLDIDHMRTNMDFTVDDATYSGLGDYMKQTKTKLGLRWIMILDPAIASVQDYEPYQSGLKKNVFIKRSASWDKNMFPENLRDVNITFGKVWPPAYVAFPDFFLDTTKEWWMENIIKHREKVAFDGLWIDMNEPANFDTNEMWPSHCSKGTDAGCWALICPHSTYEDPPYNPLQKTYIEGERKFRISWKTLCMQSVQGNESTPFLHYDVHSLYGWSQTQTTLEAAQKATGKRSMVFSRSTYPSSGRYAGHWLGDNFSTFKDMKRSIIGMLEFNIFGIPYVGADVCGFNWDTSDELCKRWMQLGAFYPFYRNHNAIGQKDQDPAILSGDGPELSMKAVVRRLNMNPYLYTLFYRAHVDGSTVVRPLFHEFSTDNLSQSIDTEFMWGKSLLITPLLEEGQINLSKYLPKDEWWTFANEKSRKELFTGAFVTDTQANEYTPAHVRGGTILPCTNFSQHTAHGNYPSEIVLYIFPKADTATGELFFDDGESIDTIEKGEYVLYQFKYTNCKLQISKEERNYSGTTPVLESIVVFKVRNIGSAYSGDTQYRFTKYDEFDSVVITVEENLNSIGEIKWGNADKGCQMLY